MAWERLKTDYKDAVWSGLRKFIPIDNGDGSYSVKDVTQYTVYDESFFGAYDANRINTAVNAIMAALENGTDLYEVFTEFFENQKVEFDKRANLDLDSFNIFLDNLQATANADVVQLKKDYTSEMTTFDNHLLNSQTAIPSRANRANLKQRSQIVAKAKEVWRKHYL